MSFLNFFLLVAAGCLVAGPSIVAQTPPVQTSKRDSLLDRNGDGKVNPGDTIRYTVDVNTDSNARGSVYTLQLDPAVTLVPGSIQSTPIARDDSYPCTGNVGISVPAGSGLLANDSDPDDSGLAAVAISAFDAVSVSGGTVIVTTTNGSFSYTPPAGFQGSDSFSYTIDDGEGNADQATVSITVNNVIWFIDNSAAPGDGRLATPFNSLSAFVSVNGSGAAGSPGSGDCIFLHDSGGGTYGGGLTLQDDQILFGQGASAPYAEICDFSPATHSNVLPVLGGDNPTIVNTATNGTGIRLASNNTIRGIDIGQAGDGAAAVSNGIGIADNGGSVGSLSISECAVSNPQGAALVIANGGILSLQFDGLRSENAPAEGIMLQDVSGSLDVTTATSAIVNSGGDAIEIVNSSGLDVDLGTVDIDGGVKGIDVDGGIADFDAAVTRIDGVSGRAIHLRNAAGDSFDFGQTDIGQTTAVGDIGIDLGSNNAGADFSFAPRVKTAGGAGLLANNSGTIRITNSDGSFDATGGPALDIRNTSTGDGWTLATLRSVNSATQGIYLDALSGDGITVNGSDVATLIDNPAGEGIVCANTNGVNISFSNVDIDRRAGIGILIDNCDGATASISFGDVDIPNQNGAAAYGIRIEDSQASCRFASTDINNTVQGTATTDAGGDGIPDNEGDGDAIFLMNNSGGFAISGAGSQGNGGTLGSLATDGIDIRNSGNLNINNLIIEDIGTSSSNPATIPDAGIFARNLGGTNLLRNTIIRRAETDDIDEHVRIKNNAVDVDELRLDNVDISNSTIGSGGGSIRGANGLLFEAAGNMDANVFILNGSDASSVRLTAWFFALGTGSGGSGDINIVVDGSTLTGAPPVISGGVIQIGSANDIAIGIQDNYNVNYNILNNTIQDVKVGATLAGVISNVSGGSADVVGRIYDNIIDDIRGRRGINLIAENSLSSYSMTLSGNRVDDLAAETISGANFFAREALGLQVRDNVGAGVADDAEIRISGNRFGTVSAVGDGSSSEGIQIQTKDNAVANILLHDNEVIVGPGGSEAVEVDIEDNSDVKLTVSDNNPLSAESDDPSEDAFDATTEDAGSTLCLDLDNNTASPATQHFELSESAGSFNVEDVATDNTGVINVGAGVSTGGGNCTLPSGVILATSGRITQTAAPNSAYNALEVKLRNSDGSPANGVTVSFNAPGSGASGIFPSGNSAVTNASGTASVPFTANAAAGPYQVTATAAGFEQAVFYLRNMP